MAVQLYMFVVLLSLLVWQVHAQSQIRFNPTTYFPELAEEQPVGSEVVRVNAFYFDSFGRVRTNGVFSIPEDGDAQFFTIETVSTRTVSSGVIRTATVIDRDTPNAQVQFTFPVTYTTPDGTSAEVSVNILLADVNDNSPRFAESEFDVFVLEATQSGSIFFNLTATDPDQVLVEQVIVDITPDIQDIVERYTVANGRILYDIVSGNELGHFDLNRENGSLSIASGAILDVDLIDLYNLTVTATDGGGLSDTTTVLITVLDSNDNAPKISGPLGVNISIPEDTPPGFVVIDAINATDLDSGPNAEIRFLITSGDITNSFTIDPLTGELIVSSPLDREQGAIMNLTVAARDLGIPQPLQDTINVVIRLLDINDYTPQFSQTSYTATVNENSRIGTRVIQLETTDLDDGPNGTVTYTILEGSSGDFILDNTTGEIFTNVSLDREEVESYFLVIEAVDNPENISYQLSSVVNITILIGDLNDNPPIFDQASYSVEILDNVRRFSEILRVRATDLDSGPNADITYRIQDADPNDPNAFNIRPDTGVIFRMFRITFEAQSVYNFTVRALDNGASPQADQVRVTIFVHNVNENPPMFEQEEYNTTILEITDIGMVVLNVSASDDDVGRIGEVRYRIISEFDQAGSFEVDEVSGEVYVNSTLDFDFRDFVLFQIEAYDGGFPEPYTDVTNITVFLRGTNDEAPSIIFPDGFQLLVPENADPEIEIVTLRDFTFDPDFDLGGEFNFSLVEIYDNFPNDSFSLNETTGLITSLRRFDREQQPDGIMVAIETTDFGTPQQSRVTNITIMIDDKNDQEPYFESNATATVYEFMPPGTEVLREYRAVDEDIGTNAQLEYQIFSGIGAERFTIDPGTGGIFTAEILNKTEQNFYNLTIIALDQGALQQLFGFGVVFIEVLDANDMVPIFSQLVYNTNFSEADPVGTFLLQVNATDLDIGTNAVIEYFLEPNTTHDDRFFINSTTGELFTSDVFDREIDDIFELSVIAVDNGLVPLTGSATVLVDLLDFNDETPIFNETSYKAFVVENSENGTVLVDVLATDEDAEAPNNIIVYTLTGNRSDVFFIDPSTGVVSVNGEVDWEEGGVFNITVVASDLGIPSRSSEAVLTITIEDVNDQAPVFARDSLNLTIFENTDPGNASEVGYVMALDSDSDGNNSMVTYSILMDYSNNRFMLNSETGLVTFVRGTLNRERRDQYDLLIRATDHGSPRLFTNATLIITILDSNDFDPVFDLPLFAGSIPERATSGTSVLTLRATDTDIGSNGDLRYSIPDSSFHLYFGVNETTGLIFTTGELFDFEAVTRYTFEVVVSDLGDPSRSATSQVIITITDSNDHPPVFSSPVYSAAIRENLASGTVVLRVNATDEDTNENAKIELTIKPGDGSESFGIDPETGVLYTNSYINREETPCFNLTIIANNSATPYPLSDEALVLINVTDLNDMHPSFDLVTDVPVPEDLPVNSTIYTLSPQDGDEGLNGTVEFTLLQGNEEGYFELDTQTGSLVLMRELDFEDKALFMLAIRANDSGTPSLSNFTNLLIQVSDTNDNPPIFVNQNLTVTVSSEVAVRTNLITVVAFDRDEDTNAQLIYSISGGNDLNLFELVSPQEGTIRTTVPLQSYADQSFVLSVQASDPDHSNTAQITINVLSSVGTPPSFIQLVYSSTLSEGASFGHTVFEFSGQVNFANAQFAIESGDEGQVFSIDAVGTLSLDASNALDFESQSLYQLTISAANLAGDKAFTTLNISITDENEHRPEFISQSFYIALPETAPTQEPLFTVIATDQDGASPANDITYSLTSTNPFVTSTFQVNSRSGELSLRRDLDYEFGQRSYTLTVAATNSHFTREVTIEIDVLDANRYDPVFAPSQIAQSVILREDVSIGVNIINVTATDRDERSSGDITYGLHGDHRYLDFRINTFTGQIFTSASLDRERHPLYTLEVIASDGGNPNRVATATVQVQLEDLNDNDPIWEQDMYFADIIENITVGSSVIRVNASDIDQVDSTLLPNGTIVFSLRNGYVTYSITQGDTDNHFMINPDTGVVSVISSLDRERFPEYNLTLNATDGGGRYANAYLHIVVHDVNDVTPEFTQNPYLVDLPENAENGTLVLIVEAIDNDLNQNSIVTYQFQDPVLDYYDNSSTFFLNDTTGEIFLEVPIDREQISTYSLTVLAVDMGYQSLTGVTEVRVNVVDINEFPPMFTEESFSGEVFENEPDGTVILQVNATDMDFEENATILYSIIGGNELQLFDIISETGQVVVADNIDYEIADVYELIVMATDSGPIEERLTNITNVTIFILDRNDNPPLFVEDSFIAFFPENSIPGDLVLTVNATDADSSSNAEFVFSLDFLGDSEAEDSFSIDPLTGRITLLSSNLDRERTPLYSIAVNVTDLGTPPLSSTVPLTIIVTDFNDNTPLFTAPFFEGSLVENQPPGTPVVNISATDEDIGLNAEIVYNITDIILDEAGCVASCGSLPFCNSLSPTVAPSPSATPFTIDSQAGTISSLFPLDRENISNYVLLVQASDFGINDTQLSNLTCVHIAVLDQNDEFPVFSQIVYLANISENVSAGELVIQVSAMDADLGTNADITFQLTTETQSFTIHPQNGRIFILVENFDRETQDSYNITVLATDDGEIPLASEATVVVTILDENDSPPVFSDPLYFATVQENLLGVSVFQAAATDLDIGTNAELTYSIASSVPVAHFEIDPSLGVISTAVSLDRETINSYNLTIMATDGGIPANSDTTLICVKVLDTNDEAPEFIGTPYRIQVEENMVGEEPLLTVDASDRDIGTNSEVFYSLVDVYPLTDAFVLNRTSGELSLIRQLDAELNVEYILNITASNGPAVPSQSSEVEAIVLVADMNDNTPYFSQLDYNVPLSEASPVGSLVVQLAAMDDDVTSPNSDVMFEITGGFNASLFAVNSSTGMVFVAGSLDRESDPVHVLEVTVFDGGSPQLNATTTLTVVLEDSNDNTPVFEQSFYSFNIEENAPLSFLVGRIRAQDLDQQDVTYFIPDSVYFYVNSTTGEILTAAILDREVQEVYSFTAVASDGDVAMERTANVSVNITLLDQNDVSPFFSNTTYDVQWEEGTAVDTILLTVGAFDLDLEENGTLVYSILPGNDSSFFAINSTNGEISLVRMFDRETQDLFYVVVEAQDLGEPSLSGTTDVHIAVLDNNDNVPMLNTTEYSAVLLEDTPVGTVVSYIGASDLDIDQNGDIQFFLSNNFDGTFVIGAESGVLVLAKSLDYEEAQSFSFSVIAQDHGDVSLSNRSGVFVEVVDLNDNPPVFDSEVYQVSIPENAVLGTLVFQIPATDSDSTTNGELRYIILLGNTRSAFTVDEVFGEISVVDYLDREIDPSYSLSLRVVDLGTPQLTATALLDVSILDINEHPPQFDSKVFSIHIPESTGIGTRIFTLTASDLDSTTNLTYSIVAGNTNNTFDIDSVSGEVETSKMLDFEGVPLYSLTILVSDNGSPVPFSDTTTLQVRVEDQNEHPPLFLQATYYVNVSQNTVVGTPIGHFIATDVDSSSQVQTTYFLVNSNLYFRIDSLEGTLYVSSPLTPGAFMLTLQASDGDFITTVTVHVTVLPLSVALSMPLFNPPAFDFEISESAQVGAVIGQLGQANSLISLPAIAGVFSINTMGGLVLNTELDYETTAAYVFNVMTYGTDNIPLYAIVTVRVLDYNDVTPVFESEEYYVSISELTRIGSTILVLRAYDGDQPGVNSDFEITLEIEGNERQNFNLDPSTGALVVSRSLDYEMQSVYMLTANVTNHFASPQLYSTVEITIELIDENDNSPQFSQLFYQVQVPVSTPLGTEILLLEASDPDSESNSDLVFSITHLSIPHSFTINQTSGAIATNTTLNLTITSYVISALVSDRGSPQPRSDTTTIFIEVNADNDNAPQFSQSEYNIVIPETLQVGGSVVQISARDPDTSSVIYSIYSGDLMNKFDIDPSTGLITLSSDLDYLEQSTYSLVVQATDSGIPPRSSLVAVNITVTDVNNHDPMFDQSVYEESIYENVTVGTFVLQVTASDPDTVNVTYQITENEYENGTQLFRIDPYTGELFTAAPIDREFAGQLEILVSAIDSGYPIQRSNSIPVTVTVLDLNDNPPVFDQLDYTIHVVRLLSSGQFVGMVTATDVDIVGEELKYNITADTSEGLFAINSTTGELRTLGRLPETVDGYEMTVTSFDGEFTTPVAVHIVFINDGDFCEEEGFCTSVREVNCTFDIFPFVECNPFCLGQYELSFQRRVCVAYSCLQSSQVPCVALEICLPPNMACDGVCPHGMSVCPTTNLCHVTSLSESCDTTDETCLIGQTLVQRSDGLRYCTNSTILPPSGQSCTDSGFVYCESLDECQNTSNPLLCRACPDGQLLCPDTGECVPDLVQCCRPNDIFCVVLNMCLPNTERCELPNVSPTVDSGLIYLESITSFDPNNVYSSDGHVISQLLGNELGMYPAVDSQGEQISIAIVQASLTADSLGEWQYSLCLDSSQDMCSNYSELWTRIDKNAVSETSALVLPNTARIRFVKKSIELDGAVWLRVKVWDGNEDGFLSPRSDLVTTQEPAFISSLPFTQNSAFSENTTLLTILVFPLILPPTFSTSASLVMTGIQEDVAFPFNLGNTFDDIVSSVDVPNLRVLQEDSVEGFPAIDNGLSYEDLLPSGVREQYLSEARRVNPTHIERQRALDSGQLPGVGVSLDDVQSGVWQVSLTGDPRQFINISSIVSDEQLLLLNMTSRIRFLPEADFCGRTPISLRPWDGVWNETVAMILNNGFIVSPDPESLRNNALSQYNLNSMERVWIEIECIPDKPVVLEELVILDPIPYRISYQYERLFTALVARDIVSLRSDKQRLSEFLQLTLQQPVEIKRLSPALNGRSYVSFAVDGDVYNYDEVYSLLQQRRDVLAELNFEIVSFSQDASYGPGAGCMGDSPQHYHGVQVHTFISQYASDADNNYIGLAVVAMDTQNQGVWQYHRGDWNTSISSQFDENTSVWLNFPSVSLSQSTAFLLHGNDQLRYLPNPDVYWTNRSDSNQPPSLQVKIWDGTVGGFPFGMPPAGEISALNVNTDPLVDTLQSLNYPQGLFSDDVMTIEAARYGCDGVLNSGLVHDMCCECGGSGEACEGCDGVMGSNAQRDGCDECGETSGSCLGCDFIPFSGAEYGACSECISHVLIPTRDQFTIYSNSSFLDCAEQCYGVALPDGCGICSGGITSHDFNNDMDCAGVCFGTAVVDTCGDCVEPVNFDLNRDCAGVCHGPYQTDSCGVCQLPNQNREVFENRDCAGMCFGEALVDSCGECYGGVTSLLANSTLDACGVCDGLNTSCFGCDGGINSGRIIDSCGECGGNDCSCFTVTSITPNRGPRTGGSEVIVQGAGLFLNNSDLLQFVFDREAPNCGAPYRYRDGESVPITCLFVAAEQQLQALAVPIDQSTVKCITEPSTNFETYIREFSVQVRVADGPFSNSVPYFYDEYTDIRVDRMTPDSALLDQEATVTFSGNNFLDTSFSACLIYNYQSCTISTSPQDPLFVPAVFVDSSEISCQLPAASVPCRVVVQLSLDGQSSGVIGSRNEFTYRFSSPQVEIVFFSNDLSRLLVQFDRPAETTAGDVTCMEVFDERTFYAVGGGEASCYWTDSKQDGVTVELPVNATVGVGSPLTFKNDVIRTQGKVYSYSITNLTVSVDSVRNAIQPIAVLTGPGSIPFCGQVAFSGIHSRYPGYAGFNYHWSVLVQDSSMENFPLILDYLDNLDQSASEVTLNTSLFLLGVDYYLQLYVVNSIGLDSDRETVLLLKDSMPSPLIYIFGSSEVVIGADEDLTLQSRVTSPQCAVSIGPFEFNWQLIRIVDQRRGVTNVVDLSSIHTQSSEIIIPSQFFEESTNYTVSLTVTATGLSSATTSLSVSVLLFSLQARVSGGNRTVAQSREVVLDGRNSTISAQLQAARFVWSCGVAGSADACYNQSTNPNSSVPVPIVIPESDFVVISGSTFEEGKTYVFTLTLQQGPYQSDASVVLDIVPTHPPIVEILIPNTDLLTSNEVQLSGLVFSRQTIEQVYWESLQLPGEGFVDLTDSSIVRSQIDYSSSLDTRDPNSYTPLPAVVVSNMTSRANLIITLNSLQPLLTYSFRLTAVSSDGVGYAQVSIRPDPPPHSAILSSIPMSGVALETEFTLTVSGAVDSITDTPLLYQYGLVCCHDNIALDTISATDDTIQWLSGVQSSSTFTTYLPNGNISTNSTLALLVRVFDRKGGSSDFLSLVTVYENPTATTAFFSSVLTKIENEFESNKDWNKALSGLISTLMEINNVDLQTQSLKQQSLRVFLDIFNNHLPPTQAHYVLAASLLSLITANDGIQDAGRQRSITDAMTTIVQWFERETAAMSSSIDIPTQSTGEPLFLRDNYQQLSFKLLPAPLANQLLEPWIRMIDGSGSPEVAQSFVVNIDAITAILCQESSTGEESIVTETLLAKLYAKSAVPVGPFNVSGFVANFGNSVLDLFQTQACTATNTPCLETCLSTVTYTYDLLGNPRPEASGETQILPLNTRSQRQLTSEIEGSDPRSVTLFSDTISVSISIPSQSSFLQIQDLENTIQILIPKKNPIPNPDSQTLCLYREVGGASGFTGDYTWQLDTTTSPEIRQIDSTEYFICEFNHLSEFGIGLLPPPVITDPPTEPATPPPTTSPTTAETTISTTEEITTVSVVIAASGGSPVAAIAAVIIVILIIAVVVVILLVIFLIWRKKRMRKVKISPEVDGSEPEEVVKAVKVGPLTPEQSKIPMQIIKCSESGERSLVGKMNVLPSIRLRELRHQLADTFTEFKDKPFYFLTRQLCDIEPAAEQQQFVSLVFGEKPIFIREVGAENELTRKHFCICGNAAQFECSNCSSQGYCSSECQLKDWSDKHQRECSRLAEKRKRSDILIRRQSSNVPSSLPLNESPRRSTLVAIPSSQGLSPTTPTDWKSFMSSSKPFQQPPVVRERTMSVPAVFTLPAARTTLSELATRPSQAPSTLPPLQGNESYSLQRQRQLAPITRSTSLQHPSGAYLQSQTAALPLNQRHSSVYSPGHSSLQSPLRPPPQQPFLSRSAIRQSSSLPPSAPVRHLSIQMQKVSRDVRGEPLLESDEDEYESSSSSEVTRTPSQATREPSSRPITRDASSGRGESRPPSLAVRKKRSLAGRQSEDLSGSSSSEDESSSGSESDEEQPTQDSGRQPSIQDKSHTTTQQTNTEHKDESTKQTNAGHESGSHHASPEPTSDEQVGKVTPEALKETPNSQDPAAAKSDEEMVKASATADITETHDSQFTSEAASHDQDAA